MEITTIRLPQSMKEAIEREAEERELSPTEYMRTILRNRKESTQENTRGDSTEDYAELVDRLFHRFRQSDGCNLHRILSEGSHAIGKRIRQTGV